MSDGLLPQYPQTYDDLVRFSESLIRFQAQLIDASRTVSKKLVSYSTSGRFTPLEEDGGCSKECVEDMPVVLVPGISEGGGGGGGSVNIDPETGLPIQRVFVYPPMPKWPTDVTWCSLLGLFCSAPQQASNTDPAVCRVGRQQCYNECTSIYENDKTLLPGAGPDYASRYRICIRECLERKGCYNY